MVDGNITGIVLDPPYLHKGRVKRIYKEDNDIFKEVMSWAIENGNNEKLRIILCGYDEDYAFPEGWLKYNWQTNGGIGNQGNKNTPGKSNKLKETIWCSPYCIKIE